MGELLVVGGVCKGFWRGESWLGVLKDVSLEVERGQIVGVIGQRLGGKTTLLEVAAGMQTPDAGIVTLGGRPLANASPSGVRGWWAARGERAIAPKLGHDLVWVTRDGPHQELEVSKYVGWPLAVHGRPDVRTLAAAALERVGAQDCISRQWGELSNWQRVLVGLARGFAGKPQLVIIDDLLDGHTSQDTSPGPGGGTSPGSSGSAGGAAGGAGVGGAPGGGVGAVPGGFGPAPGGCASKGPGLAEAGRCKSYQRLEETEEEIRRDRESEEPHARLFEYFEEGGKWIVGRKEEARELWDEVWTNRPKCYPNETQGGTQCSSAPPGDPNDPGNPWYPIKPEP